MYEIACINLSTACHLCSCWLIHCQVYFQNNPLSGVFVLAALFIQSTRVAIHGLIAITCGNLTGVIMGFDKSFLSCGLFGYNSIRKSKHIRFDYSTCTETALTHYMPHIISVVGLALSTFYSSEKNEGYYWPIVVGTIVFACFSR
jgi:urea transporter